ncbi:hypothetical protein Q9233_017876, partial [Columba guinea]
MDWTGLDWDGLDWTGMDWTGVDCTGLQWTGLDWTGVELDSTGMEPMGDSDDEYDQAPQVLPDFLPIFAQFRMFFPQMGDSDDEYDRRRREEHGGDPYHSAYELPYSGGGSGPNYGPPQPWGHPDMHVLQHPLLPIQARLGSIAEVELGPAPPVLKSFKEFLLSLDDAVDETDAVRRYNDYKLEFRRQQLQDFFLAHKDEE